MGLYLLAALGNVVTSGAGPYDARDHARHAPSPTSRSSRRRATTPSSPSGTPRWTSSTIAWEGNKPLDVAAKLVGGVLSFPASFAAGTDECDRSNYFTPVGGSFKVDVDGATLAAVPVTGGKITVKRGAQAKFFSGAIEAGDV